MDDNNSPADGSAGTFPEGTYGASTSFNYNGLKIALKGNIASAMNADHDRVPNETITPEASRNITGPAVLPNGNR